MSKKKNRREVFTELVIDSIGNEGVAIARENDVVHFVKGAAPGDRVKVQILKKRKRYVETRLVEVLEPSKDRIDPICKHYSDCGGCSWQHLNYKQQLFWKRQNVFDSFSRIGHFENPNVKETLQSPIEYNYRNKMEFSFSAQRWLTQNEIDSDKEVEDKNFALGLHAAGNYMKVIDIKECHIQPKKANAVLDAIRRKALELNISAYDTRINDGFLRNLIVRTTKEFNHFLLILVTKEIMNESEQAFVDWFTTLNNEYNYITNLIHAVNDTNSPVKIDRFNVVLGTDYIKEKVLDVDFEISPFSFFQTNSYQLSHFIKMIIDKADIKEHEVLWDLYCGSGSIILPAAQKAKELIGIELVESSIRDAKRNADLNNISNSKFYCADLHSNGTPELLESLPLPDTIIIDPPRSGIHKNLVEHLIKIAPSKIVYVSCNPATQARDCELLSEKYTLGEITPVDMFPHTFHIESIAVLTRKNNDTFK